MTRRDLFTSAVLLRGSAAAQTAPQPPLSQDARMAWWREGRFGMFIHWGLYSVLGGEWQGRDYGKEMGGASAEWIMLSAKIPRDEYAALAARFNPVDFTPEQWVSAAREAGMKYLVITAKHHDGFSMFRTKMTPYNIVDATPFKRDPIKELAGECFRQGIRFGVYYSHSRDWYHRKAVRTDPDPPSRQYVDFVKGQLRELLTNYGPLGVIWFDTGDQFAAVNSEYGKLVRELQPNCLVSGRLRGTEGSSDYTQEGDRQIPPRRVTGDVETPMTLRDNWGFDRDENHWKSESDILQRLSLTVCRGANMLLNVGPTPEGMFLREETGALRSIGRWMARNSEAVHGTTASPFDFDFEWGSLTQKPDRLYLHVLKWNPDGITVEGLRTRVRRAFLAGDPGAAIGVRQEGSRVSIMSPTRPTEGDNPAIIGLELDGPLVTDPAVTGTYHWKKDVDIRLNQEKIARQRAK